MKVYGGALGIGAAITAMTLGAGEAAAPSPPKGATPNKYVPHQGKREMARRAKRLAAGKAA